MSEAFTVYLRNEEKVLLMQRADGISDFPGAWDGIYGLGDPSDLEAVAKRIEECTGMTQEEFEFVRTGTARGLEYGNRLNDVTPILGICTTSEVKPSTLYKNCEWVDPGRIKDKEYSTPKLTEMYGDVASYLYILKTSIGQEQNVAKEQHLHRNSWKKNEDKKRQAKIPG